MKSFEVNIIESTDSSVQCIHALQQVMDYFCNGSTEGAGIGKNLSPMGHDKRSVIAWFTNRYVADTPTFKIG